MSSIVGELHLDKESRVIRKQEQVAVKCLLEVQHDHATIFAHIHLAFDAVVQIEKACFSGMEF